MKKYSLLLAVLLLVPGLALAQNETDSEEPVENPATWQVSLDEVPAAAMQAARDLKPDVYFSDAQRVTWRDEPVYRIMGTKSRTLWSVYVNVQGEVFHVSSSVRKGGGD